MIKDIDIRQIYENRKCDPKKTTITYCDEYNKEDRHYLKGPCPKTCEFAKQYKNLEKIVIKNNE